MGTGGRVEYAVTTRVLVLGGTGEAAQLASTAVRAGFDVVSSLAGRTERPRRPAGDVRVGGFGGASGLARYLSDEHVDAVVIATHPFATRIAAAAAQACAATGVPVLALRRPAWRQRHGERWHRVADLPSAAAAVSDVGSRALLTIGRQDLAVFADIGRVWFLIRCVEEPAGPLPRRSEVLLARGPYTIAGERALLRDRDIDVVVTRNSGGGATAAKLDAARDLHIPVVMVDRPPGPDVATVADVDTAMTWLADQRAALEPSTQL